ncbi:MAG: DUF2208 domain-containing protein [Candidatus Aenigmarchaeota archaeon]|nr:DUF2208 domain-containing protein [Candidatus Aenigmarchaeota archaeon]
MLSSVWNVVFSPILGLHPAIAIFIVCGIITTVITLINKKTMGTTDAKEVKKEMEEARKKMMEAQKNGEKEEVDKHMKKMMEMNSDYLQKMMKPMMVSLGISMLIVILVFPWLRETFSGVVILTIPEALPLLGGKELTWLVWYVICSVGLGLGLRKIMGV